MSSVIPPPGDGDPTSEWPAQSYSQPAQPPPSPAGHRASGYPAGTLADRSESDAKGFLGSLFDFSFNSFVTPKIVKFVYVLAVVALALVYVISVIGGFTRGAVSGIIILIVGAVAFLVYLAFIRMTLEFYYAIVRMSEDIHHRRA